MYGVITIHYLITCREPKSSFPQILSKWTRYLAWVTLCKCILDTGFQELSTESRQQNPNINPKYWPFWNMFSIMWWTETKTNLLWVGCLWQDCDCLPWFFYCLSSFRIYTKSQGIKNISHNTWYSPTWLLKRWKKYYVQEYWMNDPVTSMAYFREIFLLLNLINSSMHTVCKKQ